MSTPNQIEEEFRRIFLHHLSVVHNKDLDRLTRIEGRLEIRRMLASNSIPRIIVVKTIIAGLRLYPESFNYIFESLLRFIMTNEAGNEETGVYPELMWILASSEFFADNDTAVKMFDIIRALIWVAGREFARSYLNYRLLNGPKDNARVIIPAYYYTRHDMDSLRLVSEFVSHDDPTLPEMIYGYGVEFASSHAEKPMSSKDIDFLVEFFHKGLKSEDETVRVYCEQALKKLKQP
jgi:hypothetical protein